jgi:sirohydrochlorin cobaltochelatase
MPSLFVLTAKPNAALLIIGHGSTMNPDSSAPTHAHADAIRELGLFAEVACAFWKEEPNMREVFAMIESEVIYIVPNFISEGYFCQEVLPRELRLDGPITHRDGKTLYYCDPVGIHANMKRLLLQRAGEIVDGVPPEQTSLVIVGHGTSLNENSTKAIQDQVTLIREGGHGFAEVIDAYMEQAPLVSDWVQLTRSPNVVVVPFFIADGLHSYQDIPVLLGIMEETGAALSEGGSFGGNPHHLHDRKLYYSNAIGTEPLLAEVILDQVADFDTKHGVTVQGEAVEHSVLEDELSKLLAEGVFRVGEISVQTSAGGLVLCHQADVALLAGGGEGLEVWNCATDARLIARNTEAGKFRPLHSAPTMRRGWRLDLPDVKALRLALDCFYPAALGAWKAEREGRLQGTPLREYLGRQTGMYRFANGINDDQAHAMVAKVCGGGKCLRRITWPLHAGESAMGGGKNVGSFDCADGVELLCIEPCPFIVGAARKIARENFESKAAATDG